MTRHDLPLHPPRIDPLGRLADGLTAYEAACELDGSCITCGDVAVELTVVEVAGADARCRDDEGREELVAVDLVGAVRPGDRLLVHARVAIERLTRGESGR